MSSFANAASTDKKTIQLRSSDGEIFFMDENVAVLSGLLKGMIDSCSHNDNAVPVPNVTSKILAKVIDYCKRHMEPEGEDELNAEDELKAFDAEFVKVVDQKTLFELIMAANFLNVKGLLDLTCQAVADMIKDKTPQEVREFFNITNDFTKDEEAEIRMENAWAY